ncbi:MAG: DNA topoisomerase IV subunit B, partial [Clostridia bacterium]|nr:DNA topoisomerase IV subunit B [Clostridia bacterium]
MEQQEIRENQQNYDASQIQVLEGLEAVRRRPGMYIGSTDTRGLHHLVTEVVDNSIDEALAGFCTHIEINIHPDESITVADNGRGIPVGYHEKTGKDALTVALTILHAGGKFGGGGYKVSGGLHGVGVSCVNALSSRLRAEVHREGHVYVQEFMRGEPLNDVHIERDIPAEDTGTFITFLPDDTVFDEVKFNFDTMAARFRELAFLNAGIRITLTDERENPARTKSFCYEGGIVSFVEHLNKNKEVLHPTPMYFTAQRSEEDGSESASVEVAMQYNDGY